MAIIVLTTHITFDNVVISKYDPLIQRRVFYVSNFNLFLLDYNIVSFCSVMVKIGSYIIFCIQKGSVTLSFEFCQFSFTVIQSDMKLVVCQFPSTL